MADYFSGMAKTRQPLRIPKELLEKSELSDRRRAAWKIMLSDERLFRDTGDHYELMTEDLPALVSSECGVEAGGHDLWTVLAGYCEGPTLAEIENGQFFNEEGMAIDLPRELAEGKTLKSAVLRAAVAHSSVQGEDLRGLGRSLVERIRGRNSRQLWQTKKLANLKDSPLSVITISTETGMVTVGPARDLDHRGTQVLDRENARVPVGFFAGGPSGAGFQKIFCAAVASWLRSPSDDERADKQAVAQTEPIDALVRAAGLKNAGGVNYSLADFLEKSGDEDRQKFFDILLKHGRRRGTLASFPLQLTAGHGGDIHLGQLPAGLLHNLLVEGRRTVAGVAGEDGEVKNAPVGLFLGEEDTDRFVEQYSEAWSSRRRAQRLELIRETMGEVKRGSIGFLEIIKGGTTLANKTGDEGWVRHDMEDSVSRLLKTIESHYREGMPQGEKIPPAGLVELCNKFLEDDKNSAGKPTKRAEILQRELEEYSTHSKPSFTVRNSFYQAVSTYMVDRFGTAADKGKGRDTLVRELGTLVGAGDRTQFLYVITDPGARTTKVGITNNLEGRLKELERENGTMVPVAYYAIKSIPVAQWGTGLMDFLTESGANCGLRGGGAAEEARTVARERWMGLTRIFGFGRAGRGGEDTPAQTLEFFCEGIGNMIRDQGRDPSDFILRHGDGPEEAAKVRWKTSAFLRKLLQAPTETKEGCVYPDQFIDAVTNLWLKTQGSISFGDAATQRECITNINNALSSLFVTQADKDGAVSGRVRDVLNAAAELSPAPGGDEEVSTSLLEEISKHGEHLGAKAFEWDIHQFLQPLRMGKSEMFYVGTNYPAFLDIIEERMGAGVAGRRFALGRDDEEGKRMRMVKEDLSLTIKPAVCLSSGAGCMQEYKNLRDNAEIWGGHEAVAIPQGKADKEAFKDNLRAVIVSRMCGGGDEESKLSREAVEGVLGGLKGKSACSSPCPLGDEARRREWISDLKSCGTGDNPQLTINKGGRVVKRQDLLEAALAIDAALSDGSETGRLLSSLAVVRNEAERPMPTRGRQGARGRAESGRAR